jgi:hypothetical protein
MDVNQTRLAGGKELLQQNPIGTIGGTHHFEKLSGTIKLNVLECGERPRLHYPGKQAFGDRKASIDCLAK